jgi:hypothetical protein
MSVFGDHKAAEGETTNFFSEMGEPQPLHQNDAYILLLF